MKIGIIGTGVFGLAIASILHKNGHDITMWTAFEEEKDDLESNRVRSNLNNYRIPDSISFTNDIESLCLNKDIIFIAVPAQFVSSTCNKAKPYITDQHICIASKGIEESSSMFLPDIVKNVFNTNKIGVISGPSFAIDIINNVPIGLSLASYNPKTSDVIYKALENDLIKMFKTNDVIGTCLCGAVKNVLAISSGIISGLNYPISTQAMLITQALHDVEELIINLGGNPRTIVSFAGFGDIILTCTSEKSRNYSFGQMIGKGTSKDELNSYMERTTIEGLTALRSIHNIITDKNIDIPIIKLIYDIVYNNKDCKEIINFLTK
jgi:glycerol-3-phosphate dehydrogenase (NAD(P)+)